MIDLAAVATALQTIKPNEQVLVTRRWLEQALREMELGQSLMRSPIAARFDHLVGTDHAGRRA